jgi:hypothetical protein
MAAGVPLEFERKTRTFYYMTTHRIRVRIAGPSLCRHHRQALRLEMLANVRVARTPRRRQTGQQRWTQFLEISVVGLIDEEQALTKHRSSCLHTGFRVDNVDDARDVESLHVQERRRPYVNDMLTFS